MRTRRMIVASRTALTWVLAVVLALVFVQIFSPARFRLGALQIDVRASLSLRGETVAAIPPFGEVWAETHSAPLRIIATLSGFDYETLGRELQTVQNREDFVRRISANWEALAWRFGLRLIALGLLGGLCSLLLVHDISGGSGQPGQRVLRRVIGAVTRAGAGGVAVAVLLALTAATYNPDAFKRPRYVGMIQAAPWVINVIDQGLDHVDQVGRNLQAISGNLAGVFDSVDQIDGVGTEQADLKVLHVSDLHNNPAGLDFALQVARSFNVDLIIDTGDLTDYGTAIEASAVDRLRNLSMPYVFIPGNHDSPEVVRYLRGLRNVIVADGRLVNVKGLSIYGLGDPASHTGEIVAPTADYERQASQLAEAIRSLSNLPDIVAVHNDVSAQDVRGVLPVILHGHDHRASVSQTGNTVEVDAGTTGAAGIRGLQSSEPVPYSVALLHFTRTEGSSPAYRLTAVDAIRVFEPRGKLILERRVFSEISDRP